MTNGDQYFSSLYPQRHQTIAQFLKVLWGIKIVQVFQTMQLPNVTRQSTMEAIHNNVDQILHIIPMLVKLKHFTLHKVVKYPKPLCMMDDPLQIQSQCLVL